MNFAAPVPYAEAIRAVQVKGLLPTTAGSYDLRRLAPEIRELALFSARTNDARYLQTIQDVVTRLVSPETVDGRPALPGEYMNRSTARTTLQEALRSLGYSPGTDPNHPIPGSIQDLSSDARVDLVTQTLTDLARGRGKYELDRNPDRLEAWPAQELFRLIETRVQRNWAARWAAAGGSFYGGRMIALKDDEVWQNLGDGDGGYEDTLGLPYPPFAFNSGMWVEDVSREEAISLGLLAPEDVVEPNPERGWGEALQAGVNGLSQALQNVLLQLTPGARITDGILHFAANSEDLRGRVFKPSVLGLSPCTESP